MKIAVINPPFYTKINRNLNYCSFTSDRNYPIWLSYLACTLINNNYEIVFFDLNADGMDLEKSVSRIQYHLPDLVVVQASVYTAEFDIGFMYLLKKRMQAVRIVVVGDLPTVSPGSLLFKNPFIDFVCIGFFERTVLRIIRCISEGRNDFSSIPGLGYRREDDGIEVNCTRNNELPDLNGRKLSHIYRKYLNYRKYSFEGSLLPVIAVQTSRGCQWKCTYCANARIFCNNQRIEFPVEEIISELDHIVETFSEIREVSFDDINFHSSNRRTIEICEAISKRNYPFMWSANVRPDIGLDVLKKMKASGCRLLNTGMETFDSAALRHYRRSISEPEMMEFIENCLNLDIKLNVFVMIGGHSEKKSSLKKLIEFAGKYRKVNFQVQRLVLFPNTDLFREATEDMIIAEKQAGYIKYHTIERPELNTKDIDTFMGLFRKHRESFPVVGGIKQILFNWK